MLRLSIVVPAFNEERLLGGTLAAIRDASSAFVERGWEVEVIVCDNNSSDRTAAVAEEHGARVVFEPINQIARARNAGASVARGDWLLFIDADSSPSRELLAEAERLVARGDVLYAGAVVRLEEALPPLAAALVGCWNFLSRSLRWMAGSFVLVETAAFREVGGFDLRLYAGEEVELSRRLKRVARRRRMRGAIITRHALSSSARRLRMCSRGELARFILRAVTRPWATTASREACAMWYDGRR